MASRATRWSSMAPSVPSPVCPRGYVRLRLLNAANARNFDLRFSDRRPFFVIAGDGGLLAEPVEVRSLVIAPARKVRGAGRLRRWPPRRPRHRTRCEPWTGHDDARWDSARLRRSRAPVAVQARSRVEGRCHPPPRQLATLAAPDVKSAVAWRTFELNPMMGMGMMGMG